MRCRSDNTTASSASVYRGGCRPSHSLPLASTIIRPRSQESPTPDQFVWALRTPRLVSCERSECPAIFISVLSLPLSTQLHYVLRNLSLNSSPPAFSIFEFSSEAFVTPLFAEVPRDLRGLRCGNRFAYFRSHRAQSWRQATAAKGKLREILRVLKHCRSLRR